jgi:UDP-GlcNAc:undecaprenyl-phosphate GlcNAc-1-phosphate transferase
MGDAGSMFIGFILGVLSISSIMHHMSIYAIIIPIFILLVPIADMGIAILRRLVNKQPIVKADKRHLHHILKERFSTKIVVLIIGIIQMICAAFGVLIFIYEIYKLAWIIFSIGFVIVVFLTLMIARIKGDNE